MRRFLILLLLVSACKKKEESAPEPEPQPTTGARGYSVTKVGNQDDGSGDEAGGGGKPGGSAGEPVAAAQDAGAPADAARFGGNGAPPYIDDEGHLHGPGGPIFMGRGDECNEQRNHCLREPVWFAVGNLVAGKLYRAVPIFEYESKWYNWRGKEEDFAMRLRTKVGTRETLKAGDPVIWFIDENASKKFVDNEYDALTSSRWEAGVIESVGADKIRVKGWTYGAVPIETTRIVVEQK